MNSKKILLFEPMDTDFGGHYFEHSSTYIRFLMENGYNPVFVLGGKRTEKLENLLKDLKVKYYKLGVPVYKSRSRLPPAIKNMINIPLEILRHSKILKIAKYEGADLITFLTFGVYEPLQLYIASKYEKMGIPIKVIIHTITIDEEFSLNPKKMVKQFLSFLSLVFLRKLAKGGVINNIVVYSGMAEEFYRKNVTKNVTRVLHPINFDYDKFVFTKEYSQKLIGLEVNEPMLLLLNPDARGKSIDNLFASLPNVKESFKLVAAGYMSPSFETKIKSLVDELGLKDKIVVINRFLSSEEKHHYINASDLVLLPYKTSYKKAMATSSILAEAIMMLKPVIITNGVIEGNDFVRENNLGLVIDDEIKEWSENLNMLLQNIDRMKNLAKSSALNIRRKFRYTDLLKQVYNFNTNGGSDGTS